MKKWFKKSSIRFFFLLIFILFALPLGWKEFTGFSTWLSPFVMLNSVILLKSFVWLNIFGFVILIICLLKKRWFCKTLCPAGLLCDAASGLNVRKTFSLRRIPRIGRWLAILSPGAALTGIPLFILLDPMSIFNGFFSVFSEPVTIITILSFIGLPLIVIVNIFFPGIWCARLCPLGGLQDELVEIKEILSKKDKKENSPKHKLFAGRRIFIAWGAGIIAGLFIPRWLKNSPDNYFRPPASIKKQLFNT
ncbi:MAG: 4Fe-4S binding protein, partial [Prolixibacteraceae bacterium]|nr:4Fe-4S binding protein [Prolixibacteraceae bacterium]